MYRILVTGGAGFIGSHTCLSLLENGFEVMVVDSFVNSTSNSLKNIVKILEKKIVNVRNKIQIVKGDLRKKQEIDDLFSKCLKDQKPINAVIHLAGLKSVAESNINSLKYWDFNVLGTINLLKIMEKYDCRTLVFSSSATIYKTNEGQLINEKQKLEPINPYGMTKLSIEHLLYDVFKSGSKIWKIANLRYFNPIGAHPSGLLGEDPRTPPNNIFPIINNVAIGKLEKIKIYGKNWPTKDGTGVRDYIHIMDVAEAHYLSLKFLMEYEAQILSMNLGTGLGTSVLELINVFEKVNNVRIPYKFVDRRKGDNAYVVSDNSFAKSILNWSPKYNLSDMCRDGWKWQVKNK